MMFKKYLVIISIILLAAVLRFYHLDNLPALNADEAAIGYNAYSLLQTGKDEHGNSWPIHFQSFNDYKPGLYFYLVLPFVKLLGLNVWAVRIPGATLGVATVFVVWLLVRFLFPGKKWLPEICALFLAISPWHIHFSRGGWEVNAATFFITLGVWSLVRFNKNPKWLVVSALSFVASLYTYHAARIVVPLLLLGLVVYYSKDLFKNKKILLLSGVLGIILVIPLTKDLLGPAGISRASGVGLFADLGPYNKTNQQRGEHSDPSGPVSTLLHNKFVNYGLAFAQNYTKHFSGDFLFISGDDIERNKVPEFGQMYLFDILFLAFGIGAIFKNSKGWFPILWWLAVSPIAAALTFQSPHALRAQNMVIPLVIISGYGAWELFSWLNKHISSKFLLFTFHFSLFTFVLWNSSYYLHQYYSHMAKTYDYSSQYGVKELAEYVRENQDKFQNVVVTTRYDQPYILFLFYLNYPPQKFQQNHVLTPRDKFGFSTVEHFDKYVFTSIDDWNSIKKNYRNSLIAGSPEEIPDGANVVKKIYFPSGNIAFKIVAN